MSMTRHVGRMKNTGSRVAIVFRKLEEEPDQCLICEVERLPDLFHDNLMDLINSNVAQSTVNLYEALQRSVLSDGTNALATLHQRGYMKKVPVDMVEAMPMPGRPVDLLEINRAIDGDISPPVSGTPAPETPVVEPAIESTMKDLTDIATDEKKMIAQNLLIQAEQMIQDAEKKRNEAYTLAPDLAPKSSTPAKKPSTRKGSSTTRKKTEVK